MEEEKLGPFAKIPEDRTAVDNILRINHGNQMRLGLMADAKANIMITVSSFAIFAIIPKTAYPKVPGSDEIDRSSPWFNPLFFGHFAHLPIEEYKENYANKLMTDDKIYDALAGDIYGQGKVLALSKYKYLKWSYNSFLIGMSLAIFVFLLQSQIDNILTLKDIIFNELSLLSDGFKEVMCMASTICRENMNR